jgi:hypothetical protein
MKVGVGSCPSSLLPPFVIVIVFLALSILGITVLVFLLW